MNIDVELRVPFNLVPALLEGTKHRQGRESVAFGLVSSSMSDHRLLLLVRDIRVLPDEAYVRDAAHGAKWEGRAMFEVLNEALARKLGVVLFHTHSGNGTVALSRDDRRSANALLPRFANLIPQRPHGSVVFNLQTATGVFALPHDHVARGLKLRLYGDSIHDLPESMPISRDIDDDEIGHRQALLIGGAGDRSVRSIVVAVIGLSGGGSHVVQQLAHAGFARIVGIDGDRCERSNRGRLVGMTWLDGFVRARKVDVMRRMVRRINSRVKFHGVFSAVPNQEAINAIKSADIVIGCVDSYHARADIHELTSRFMLPYIDIGLIIRPSKRGVQVGGNVITTIPGRFCQWCFGFLSEDRLAEETGGRARTYFEGTDKQAQVVSMNGLLASQVVNEALQLATGFAGRREPAIWKYDGIRGILVDVTIGHRLCKKCKEVIGAGDPVWEN